MKTGTRTQVPVPMTSPWLAKRRKSSFFGSIYRMLYKRYAPVLSDSLSVNQKNLYNPYHPYEKICIFAAENGNIQTKQLITQTIWRNFNQEAGRSF